MRALQEERALAAAAAETAKAESARKAAEVAASQAHHNERARARELADIEASIKSFRDAFVARHGRKPTPRDMESAAHSRQRIQIERYNQLKHGVAPPGLKRKRGS